MENWQYALHTEKLADRDTTAAADPTLVRLTAQLPVADMVTERFNYLLRQFPIVQRVNQAEAKRQYLIDLAAALGQVYYVRLRIVELDDRLPIPERRQKMDQLLTEYTQYIDQFKVQLKI